MTDNYKAGSLTLTSTVAMGIGAIISGFSAYTYIKVTRKYPSAGGVAMILEKAYGHTVMTSASALLMVSAMIINESLGSSR